MQRTTVATRWMLPLTLAGWGALFLAAGAGVASADIVSASPDVTTQLATVPFHDEDVAVDNQAGLVAAEDLGPVPSQSDVVAYDSLENGDRLLAFDTSVVLPDGTREGLTVLPGDVVRYGRAGYTLEFDARASGVPVGSVTDAVSKPSASVLLLSFDTTVTLRGISGSVTAADEDLVAFVRGSFSVLFDGSVEGVPPELDLDAAHVRDLAGSFLLSFDGSGRVGGIDFADEDVLEFLPTGRWRLAFDASQQHAAWAPADLDALHVVPEPGGGLLPFSALLALGLVRALRRRASG